MQIKGENPPGWLTLERREVSSIGEKVQNLEFPCALRGQPLWQQRAFSLEAEYTFAWLKGKPFLFSHF